MIKLAANFKFYRSILNVLLIALSLAFAGQWISLPLLDKLEHIAYDSRLKASMPNTIDPRVVIIDIDEQSLEKEGRWPWDRRKMANLINRLFNDYHIKLLAFDVVFPEPDHSSGITWFNRLAENELSQDQAFLQAFNSIRPQLNFDDIFADSLKTSCIGTRQLFNPPDKTFRYFLENGGQLHVPSIRSIENRNMLFLGEQINAVRRRRPCGGKSRDETIVMVKLGHARIVCRPGRLRKYSPLPRGEGVPRRRFYQPSRDG